MTDLIERVAKAIYDANYVQGMPWSLLTEARKKVNRTQARAAIAAMRDSVDAMVSEREAAGIDVFPGNVSLATEFRAMIDAALGGKDGLD